jgi:hypothetical protein
MRAENEFGDGVASGIAVNPNGGLHIAIDPRISAGSIKLRLTNQFDSLGPGGVEASRVPAVAGFKREHPRVEGRKCLPIGDPNRQADFGQFAGVFEFIHVLRDDCSVARAASAAKAARASVLKVS